MKRRFCNVGKKTASTKHKLNLLHQHRFSPPQTNTFTYSQVQLQYRTRQFSFYVSRISTYNFIPGNYMFGRSNIHGTLKRTVRNNSVEPAGRIPCLRKSALHANFSITASVFLLSCKQQAASVTVVLTLFSVLHVLLYRHTFLASFDHKTGDQHNYVGYVLTADKISRLYTRVFTQVSRWGREGFNIHIISRLRTTQASLSVSLYNTIEAVLRCD